MNELRNHAVRELMIDEASEGQRLDNFLARVLKGVPKSHLYRIVRSGEVRVNGRRAGPDARLAHGDRVRIPPVRTGEPASPAAKAAGAARAGEKLVVLHEDDDLIALDKPAGVAVHGGSGIAHGVIERLRAARPQARFLELVHRLDRDTSGVLLVAKKRAALVALHDAWRAGDVDKRYTVLVRGRWRDAKRVVRLPVHRYTTREGERRVRVEEDGQHAQTTFRRLAVWPDHDPPLALLDAELHTGRTHQIRVHLTHLGFPLAGDDKYGDFAWNRTLAKAGLRRMFLHAARLSLAHPRTGETLALESPLPPDLAAFVASIGIAAGSESNPTPM
ncbi:MAG TPA: RluA family pseudouridine synthase [Casimicrobiaceae bacterium]|nr:RluA family pseudouridine synthase [Casimicrobiaceae bacterium]